MAQARKNEVRIGGPYMVQDTDHMVVAQDVTDNAQQGVRQSQQSHTNGGQQGHGDQNSSGQQGGERRRKSH